jgi:erythromycin esterase-like protein
MAFQDEAANYTKLMNSFNRAQAQYESQLPPGFEDDDTECTADTDLDNNDCECRKCENERKEFSLELAAEAKYDEMKLRKSGLID